MLLSVIIAGLLGIITTVGVVAWVSQDLPDPNRLNARSVAQSTKIYARDGTTLLYEIHGEQRRTLVELSGIGQYTKQATLSIEDKDFYRHRGVSLRGILRALFVDITSGRKAQGGSTITQQLVKNSILTREKTLTRKVKEVILAYQIERRFTKDQILKLYFNEIPYGSSAYGIEAAAQTYFNKHAQDLDLAESAMLSAMVRAPTYYSPTGNHPDELVARWRYVLDAMARAGAVTKDQAAEAKNVDILRRVSPTRDRVLAPHFVFYVRDILEQKYGTATVERAGLRVVTTLDPELQRIAEEEVAAGAERNEARYRATNAALVAIEPSSGQVMAMVGSRNFFDLERDGNFNVATALRNPGSSFKPVVYMTAFLKGYTPETTLFDLKTNFGPDGSGRDFSPNNYDGKEHGPLTMRQTLAGSLNIPAVKTLYLAGIPATVDVANKLGYTTFDPQRLGLALAIGGGAVRLLEHAAAFAVLANDGVRNPTTPLLRIEDARGKILELYQHKDVRVLPEQPVRQVVSIMSDNAARSFIFGSRSPLILPDRPVATKTGTTNDFRDAWTVGFAPQLAAGVWVGNNNNEPMRSGSDGVIVAAPIWHEFMRRALAGDPVTPFPRPRPSDANKPVLRGQLATEVPIVIDTVTGRQIPPECLDRWPREFTRHRFVREVHTILHYLNRDDPRGPAPADPTRDSMYRRWEEPVRTWAERNRYVVTAPPLERCTLRVSNSQTSIAISSPESNETVTHAKLAVKVTVRSNTAVEAVKYYLDDELLMTSTKAPYGVTLDLSGVANGFRALRAELVAEDRTVSASVSINVLSNQSVAALYFVDPAPQVVVRVADFPRQVRVFAYDPAGIDRLTLYLRRPDGVATELDSVSLPAGANHVLSWPTTEPGSYSLYLTVKSKSGQVTQSDLLPVSVT
ncbi:MAG: transglycosylase domain-containing protein [Candidatus Kerfeldbacteria bacterium]|nr:transglycosylase domain-containing protein [Candidatus Kerfeldbacteria bacterium]